MQGGGNVLLQKQNGMREMLPLNNPERFEVYRTRELEIARGDRIRITKNGVIRAEGKSRGAPINNGQILNVAGFTKDGDIRLENGRVLPKGYGHFASGYVDTSYASQGKTVDRVFIAAGSESRPAVGGQQWYVSVSRGRESAKVYVDSRDEIRRAIARTGERLSAVELTRTRVAARDSWRKRLYEALFERNRVARFFRRRAEGLAHDGDEKIRRSGPGKGGISYA